MNIILDRDGVINYDYGYIYSRDRTKFISSTIEFMRHASKLNYKIAICSNQSAVGRGVISAQHYFEYKKWYMSELRKKGILIDEYLECLHAPKDNCHCRKPNTGMIDYLKYVRRYDLQNSVFIGDQISDMHAAQQAGIKKTVLFSNVSIRYVTNGVVLLHPSKLDTLLND